MQTATEWCKLREQTHEIDLMTALEPRTIPDTISPIYNTTYIFILLHNYTLPRIYKQMRVRLLLIPQNYAFLVIVH